MFAWLAPILSFLGGPVISGAIGAYKAKLEAGNTAERIAADLAGRELQVQQRELEVQSQLKVAQIGHWYEPEHLFGYTMVIYFGKIVLWDKVLGYFTDGSTDALAGDAATWAGAVMSFYIGMRGFQGVARILRK